MTSANADPRELEKFASVAHAWWDPEGEFKPLHRINPLRLAFIQQHATLGDQEVLDVGCGGGILSESLAVAGARVTGIDLAEASLETARLHGLESGVRVTYRNVAVEDLATELPAAFQVVTCMEMLEHVPNPESVVRACAELVTPGGWVFFSTLNRNPLAYLKAVLGAEYLLGLLPRGTHDYGRFIKPSELAHMARHAGLADIALAGLSYHPATQTYGATAAVDTNYMLACRRLS